MLFTLLALNLRIFSNPFSNVLQKSLTQQGVNSLNINFLTYLGLSILCLLYLPNLVSISNDALLYALAGGFLGASGNAFLIKAVECGELSVLGPINSYKPVVAMIIAIFMLKEIPTILGLLGIVFIIFGSYFIFEKGEFNFSILKRKDIQYRFLALILTATEAVFIKQVIILTDITTSFVLWCWCGALFSLFLTKFRFQKVSKMSFLYILFLIISMGVMQWSTNYVFDHMNVSYALALFQLSTIVSVILGWKFFNEKDILRKLFGSVIMICGAVMLILA